MDTLAWMPFAAEARPGPLQSPHASGKIASQPGVSKSIVELEDALGVRLLDRSRRGIVPKPYGLALQRQGDAVFNELRQAVQHIDFLADPTKGEIRIGTTDPIAISLASAIINVLSRENPKMFFHVVSGDTVTLYSDVADRRVDFAVCRMIGLGQMIIDNQFALTGEQHVL